MFKNIQFLRAVAAIAVVLFHIIDHYRAVGPGPEAIVSVMRLGYVGVDLFFVISGFVMMHVLSGPAGVVKDIPTFLRGFLARRFVRIYGWYLPCLVFTAVVIWAFDKKGFAAVNWARSVTLTSVHMPELALGLSWSLTYELYFYSLISLLWLLCRRHIQLVIWVCLALLWAVNSYVKWENNSLPTVLLAPFLMEFLAGGLVYAYRAPLAKPVVMLITALVTVYLFRWGVLSNATNELIRTLSFGMAAVGLVSVFVALESNKWFTAGRLSNWVGDASYSIYLLHLPFLSVFYWFGFRDGLARIGGVGAQLGFFAWWAGFVALCVVVHYRAELPLYRWLCRKLLPLDDKATAPRFVPAP